MLNLEDLFFMVICGAIAGTVFLLLCMTESARSQDLGWLAQKQIQARQNCAEALKYRMQR